MCLLISLSGQAATVDAAIELYLSGDMEGSISSLEALLDRGFLPPAPHRINAYAIHGGAPSERQYRALYPVPGEGPDFHRLAGFREVVLP